MHHHDMITDLAHQIRQQLRELVDVEVWEAIYYRFSPLRFGAAGSMWELRRLTDDETARVVEREAVKIRLQADPGSVEVIDDGPRADWI